MNRRDFLFGGGVVAAGAVGGVSLFVAGSDDAAATDDETVESDDFVEDAPDAVEASQPLAEAFHAHITQYYPDAQVLIRPDGGVVMKYETDAKGSDELTAELHRLANEYANVVKDGYEPKTFDIVTSQVRAIAVKPTVKAYTTGEINKEAYLETIEIKER